MPKSDVPEADASAGAAAPHLQPSSSKLSAISAVLDRWLVQDIFNSPVSQSTAAINHLRSTLPRLASALAQEL